jgi:dipicolinate synthase subunit A
MGEQLHGRNIAIVGGDEREQEIARLAAQSGARVKAYGFPWPDDGIKGVEHTASAAQALNGANFALFPIPGIAKDGTLFAPASPQVILPNIELLSVMAPGGTIILGLADENLKKAAGTLGIELSEYELDTELMLRRAPAIIEGALSQIISSTRITIHNSDVLIVGYGNIGRLLAKTLVLLGARVHVAARNPVQRADAFSAGCTPHELDEIIVVAPSVSILISTVPAEIISEGVLKALPPNSLVMDLSAPPGGIDLAKAKELGHTAVWARGLGRSAPITVGASQWSGIEKRLISIEQRRKNEG